MLYTFTCIDNKNVSEKRTSLRGAHRARLHELKEQNRLFFAGPLFQNDKQETVYGSLIMAEFDSQEQAENWVKTDPYAQQGVYKSISVKPAQKILP